MALIVIAGRFDNKVNMRGSKKCLGAPTYFLSLIAFNYIRCSLLKQALGDAPCHVDFKQKRELTTLSQGVHFGCRSTWLRDRLVATLGA
jgi:hypothetical protein